MTAPLRSVINLDSAERPFRGQVETEDFDYAFGTSSAVLAAQDLLGNHWTFQGAPNIARVQGEPEALVLTELLQPSWADQNQYINLLITDTSSRWVKAEPGPHGWMVREVLDDQTVAATLAFTTGADISASDISNVRTGLARAARTAATEALAPSARSEASAAASIAGMSFGRPAANATRVNKQATSKKAASPQPRTFGTNIER